jgi:alkylhydroperoxidase/carboxymuconolactone decarboxylase family protein YurZ
VITRCCPGEGTSVDYTERLRLLAWNVPKSAEHHSGELTLDARTLALVRIAALTAIGAPVPSFAENTDAAIGAGATCDEMVDVLIGVVPIVGMARVVAAAPRLALALGFDTDDAL